MPIFYFRNVYYQFYDSTYLCIVLYIVERYREMTTLQLKLEETKERYRKDHTD